MFHGAVLMNIEGIILCERSQIERLCVCVCVCVCIYIYIYIYIFYGSIYMKCPEQKKIEKQIID